MRHAGGTGKRRGVDTLSQRIAQLFGRYRGHGVAISVHDIDGCTRLPQRIWNHVACDSGASQQNPLALDVTSEFFHKTFRNIRFRNERDPEPCFARSRGSGFANHGHLRRSICFERNSQLRGTKCEVKHGVGAGQDKPMIEMEIAKSAVEWTEILGRSNLKDWNLNRVGAQCAKTFAEFAGLVRGAGDKDATAGKRQRSHRGSPVAD